MDERRAQTARELVPPRGYLAGPGAAKKVWCQISPKEHPGSRPGLRQVKSALARLPTRHGGCPVVGTGSSHLVDSRR